MKLKDYTLRIMGSQVPGGLEIPEPCYTVGRSNDSQGKEIARGPNSSNGGACCFPDGFGIKSGFLKVQYIPF